ncbi:PhoU domain-containing protein [Pseudonocardia parietis]|uniref:Phosphate uptake regulator n=1 Tax=Pseudonocardia parietis TaxID=570936 RepID=A0ABS4W7G7_9PSEU|nr:PhoU domain-containing protein [Pseudonocardia parietis]MBP2371951.1 phosphate uptake regulator [Pseudonocardia parietis]
MADQFTEMCRLAVGLARSVQDAITNPDQAQAEQRERDDDRVDQLHRALLEALHDLILQRRFGVS